MWWSLFTRFAAQIWFSAGYGVNVATLTGNTTLTGESAHFHLLTPSGATRNVILPVLITNGRGNGQWFLIRNATGSAQSLVVKDASLNTVATLPSGSYCWVVSGGSTIGWRVMLASSGVTIATATTGITASAPAVATATHFSAGKPAAPQTTALACTTVTDVVLANGALTIAAQPNVPCKLNFIVTDANSSITAGSVAVVGVDASGRSVTETITLVGGSITHVSTKAYSNITSLTVSGLAGNTGVDKLAVGVSDQIGVPLPLGFGSFLVYMLQADGAREAIAAQDATAGTFTPTTAPNGAHNYSAMYSFTCPSGAIAIVDAGHTHAVS